MPEGALAGARRTRCGAARLSRSRRGDEIEPSKTAAPDAAKNHGFTYVSLGVWLDSLFYFITILKAVQYMPDKGNYGNSAGASGGPVPVDDRRYTCARCEAKVSRLSWGGDGFVCDECMAGRDAGAAAAKCIVCGSDRACDAECADWQAAATLLRSIVRRELRGILATPAGELDPAAREARGDRIRQLADEHGAGLVADLAGDILSRRQIATTIAAAIGADLAGELCDELQGLSLAALDELAVRVASNWRPYRRQTVALVPAGNPESADSKTIG